MGLGKKILEYMPAAAGFAAAAGMIESGIAAEISEMVMANIDGIRPTFEGAAAASVFMGVYYVAENQYEYITADGKYDQNK